MTICAKRLRCGRMVSLAVASVAFWGASSRAADLWTGANSAQWGDPGNWTTGLPQPGDDAVNVTGQPIFFNTNSTINSFTGNAGLTLQGGTLAGSQANSASSILATPLVIDGGFLSNLTVAVGTPLTITGNGNNAMSQVIVAADVNVGPAAFFQLYNGNTFSGNFALSGSANNIEFHDGNASLTIGSAATLHGQGATFNFFDGGTLINSGVVSADVSGASLTLANSNITGAGNFDARNGGTLAIGGLLNGAGATVTVDANSAVLVNGGGLTGTVASTTGSGISFSTNGNNFISNFSLTGPGTITFGQGAFAELLNGGNSVAGTIRMASTANGIRFHDGNAALTLTSAGQIRGYGATFNFFNGGTLINNGTADADVAGQTLSLQNSNVTGSGLFTAENGGTLAIAGGAVLNGNNASVVAIGGTVLIDGGTVTGSFASSAGTGITYSTNGNNSLNNASINGNLTFPQGAFAEVFNGNTVAGAITMSSTANGIRFHDGNASLTLSPTGSLHGFGATFNFFNGGTLINNGTVSGDVASQALALNNSNITGSGIFEGKNGGTLAIGGLLNGNGATVHSDTGVVLIDGGTVIGSFAASTGSGINFRSNGNNALSGAIVNGNATVSGGGFVQVFNANTVNGTINMAAVANGIEFHDGNAALTIGASGKMRGFGATFNFFNGGTLTNSGAISADVNGQTLLLAHSNTNGSGNFDARNGGVLAIRTALVASNATITVDNTPGSAVLLDGGSVSGSVASSTGSGLSVSTNGNNAISSATLGNDLTITGGGYVQLFNSNTISGTIHFASTANGIQFHDGNAALNLTGALRGFGQTFNFFNGGTLNNSGTIAADVPGQTLAINNSFLNNTGTLSVSTGATMSIGASLNQSAGLISVDGDLFYSPTLVVNGGVVSGNGTIHTSIDNAAGTVGPGHSPGLLTVTGNYQQDAAGTLAIDLAGYVAGISYDRLVIGGSAAFGGTLDVGLFGGFVPQVGDTFDVATWAGPITSSFASLVTHSDIQYTVDYGTETEKRVRVTITAIPEPASLTLIALSSMVGLKRRRRQS